MKKITKYLTEIRKNAIIYDLKLNGWKIYTIFLCLFLFLIIIENIFYLSKSLRFTTISFLFGIGIAFLSWIFITSIRIYYDSYNRYKLSNLAKQTGKLIFTKKDTLINAFQLENNANDLSSNELRNEFIEKITSQLKSFKFSELFSIEPIYKWKKIVFTSLIIVGLMISFTW